MIKKYDFEKLPIVEIVNDILIEAAKRNASDIHFDPHENTLLVRIRIDGELVDYTEIPNLYQDAEYKNKIINIYNVLEGIDTAKSGLVKEDGCDSSFNRLKQVTTRIYNKFQ